MVFSVLLGPKLGEKWVKNSPKHEKHEKKSIFTFMVRAVLNYGFLLKKKLSFSEPMRFACGFYSKKTLILPVYTALNVFKNKFFFHKKVTFLFSVQKSWPFSVVKIENKKIKKFIFLFFLHIFCKFTFLSSERL